MDFTLLIAVFLFSVTFSNGAFPCTDYGSSDFKAGDVLPSFCSRVKCQDLPEESCEDGVMLPTGGGICGCCSRCLHLAGEGGTCQSLPLQTMIDNTKKKKTPRHTYLEYCQKEYTCKSKVCTTPTSPSSYTYCVQEQYEYDHETPKKDWRWRAQCDAAGMYEIVQCKGNGANRRCFCVNPESMSHSQSFFGTYPGKDQLMNCKCSTWYEMVVNKETKVAESLKYPLLRCDSAGNYETLQCLESDLCFCVDPATGEMAGNVLPRKFIYMLSCYNSSLPDPTSITPCLQEKLRVRNWLKEISEKGMTLTGLDEPDCDPDGTFAPKQCSGTTCLCVSPDGAEITGSVGRASASAKTMSRCRCARDLNTRNDGLQRLCKANGEYLEFQCQGERCYCVDPDGYQTSADEDINSANFCITLIDCVSLVQDPGLNPCASTRSGTRYVGTANLTWYNNRSSAN